MPPKAVKRFPTSPSIRKLSTRRFGTTSPASPFVVLSLEAEKEQLAKFGKTHTDTVLEFTQQENRRLQQGTEVAQIGRTTSPAAYTLPETLPATRPSEELENADMQTRGAWGKNRANPANRQPTPPPTVFKTSSDGNNDDYNGKNSNNGEEEEETINTTMADANRPKLKLKMSALGGAGATPAVQPFHTPVPQSATQRLKLSFSRNPSIVGETVTHKANSPGRPSTGPRKITLKTSTSMANKSGPATVLTPGAALTPHVKFHVKGKIPQRKMGVGYDSENEQSERDPVILEGFILRMLPGPDRDYIQQSIENGTIGLSKVQGGASIILRMLDTHGRRGVLQVRDHKYATTMVDLPCLIEGIKSWDKKAWIKSIDICQMVLVLGPCRNDDEARNFPLPEGVDTKTYAYAHGITPPMWSVRKRRYDKTKRARVDDIEAVERKVNALLNDDARAVDSSWEIVEGDPDEMERSDGEQYSGTEEDEGQSDAEGEPEEVDDYFGRQPPLLRQLVETPGEIDADAEGEVEEDEDLAEEFARALEEGDSNAAANMSAHIGAGDSSVAVTPNSASPSAGANITQVDTPTSGDKDEAEKEEDENLRQAKERIAELTAKIKEQKHVLVKTPNLILKRKIAAKIQELEKDRRMMKAMAGGGDDEDDEDDDGAGADS
ncbi:hypothetical protein DV736_g3755, partial [Chaetothyriales sp. CBS 134916]